MASSAIIAKMSPIEKVVTLIKEMRGQVAKDGDADEAAYGKYECWCKTNEKEKNDSIAKAKDTIASLESSLEELAAREGELKTKIEDLTASVAASEEALATATALREKENTEFLTAQDDMKETISALTDAVAVLQKVQLIQDPAKKKDAATTALVQVRRLVHSTQSSKASAFRDVLERDFYDVLGSLSTIDGQKAASFLAQIPGGGAAAGSKSYNSRSGSILGMLDEMNAEFRRDLSSAQIQEHNSLVGFHTLKASKEASIALDTESKKNAETNLADTLNKASTDKENLGETREQLSADQKFLENLLENCATEKEEYNARTKIRNEELRGLSEALKILTEDDTRSLFARSEGTAFVQVNSVAAHSTVMRRKAMTRLMRSMLNNGDAALAHIMARLHLDSFTKVKAMMDKMIADLKQQQADEYEKHEECNENIDKVEDDIKVAEQKKADLGTKHKDLTNTKETLETEIANLKKAVEDMKVSLKQAGEQRKAENQVFQSSVADQRATVNVLNKALRRLQQFYDPASIPTTTVNPNGVSLVDIRVHGGPPPPKPKDYEKSGLGGGVLQLIAKIISEAESEEKELEVSENEAQRLYAKFAQETTDGINSRKDMTANKSKQLASTKADIATTNGDIQTTEAEISSLTDLEMGYHQECDYVIKYFKIRQTARKEEMDAIEDAKAILSGADFKP